MSFEFNYGKNATGDKYYYDGRPVYLTSPLIKMEMLWIDYEAAKFLEENTNYVGIVRGHEYTGITRFNPGKRKWVCDMWVNIIDHTETIEADSPEELMFIISDKYEGAQ